MTAPPRPYLIGFKVSADEKSAIIAAAKRAGADSVSEYLRARAAELDGPPAFAYMDARRAARAEIKTAVEVAVAALQRIIREAP